MTMRTWRHLHRLHGAAPLLAVACAVLLPIVFPHEPTDAAPDGAELAMTAAAVEAVPYRIGSWAGQDIPIPEAARRLLRPNAILSRRFINLDDGMSVDLVIVHCGDSRDMLGHYPPVCYPSNGWIATNNPNQCEISQNNETELSLRDLSIPSRVYHFTRSHGWSSESAIRIFNFFVLPDGTLTPDIENVGLRTNWLGARVSGVAQIQVLTDARIPCERAAQAAGDVLQAAEGVFDSLGVNLH